MAAHPAAEPPALVLGHRVPGSKGTKCRTWALRLPGSAMAGWAKGEVSYGAGHQIGTLHKVTAKLLAPQGSLCGGSLGGTKVRGCLSAGGAWSEGWGIAGPMSGMSQWAVWCSFSVQCQPVSARCITSEGS